MALTPEVDTTWFVNSAVGEGVGILPSGTAVKVIHAAEEPTAGVGGQGPLVVVVTEPPAAIRAISFTTDEFEKHFVPATVTEAEEKD